MARRKINKWEDVQTSHDLCKFIVGSFVDSPIDWPKEIKIAKQLIKRYKDPKFWGTAIQSLKKHPSLAYFLTEWGEADLRKEHQEQSLVLRKTPIFELTENNAKTTRKEIKKKPKTLMEFLTKKEYGQET